MQCPSVTFVDHVKTNKYIFEIFLPSGSDTILVFPSQRGCRYSDGNPPNGGVECKGEGGYDKMTIFSQISRCISETVKVRSAHAARQFVSSGGTGTRRLVGSGRVLHYLALPGPSRVLRQTVAESE